MEKPTKRLTRLSLLLAAALVLGALERWIPLPVPIPGAKIGLSNIAVLTVLMRYGLRDALAVAFMKSLVLMALFGSPVSFIYSVSGGLMSVLVMGGLIRFGRGKFSVLGISVAGAATHYLVQLTAAALVLQTPALYGYFPYMVLLSVPTGIFTGAASYGLLGTVEKLDQN